MNFNLKGKRAFIAGVADDQGFGWAIAKALAEAGAEIIIGTWTPLMNIFQMSLERGKLDESRKLSNGSLMEFAKIYPLDVAYDTMEEVPEEIRSNKRYQGYSHYAIKDVAESVQKEFGHIDILIHAIANGPEVSKPLLETSRHGYLTAISASAYSYVSLVKHFGPLMNRGGATLTLTYIASEKVIPGYGGGMSSAKAALESDTKTLSFEAGRKWGIRVNALSAGPYKSRAAKAIGFIETMIDYAEANAPLQQEVKGEDIGSAALFLCSPLANAITGVTLFVDNGMHIMGAAETGVENFKAASV